jgi:hypothetical protein
MTNRTWVGGGNDNASNPNDWSPAGTPQLGDALSMAQGVMNVSGDSLAGDTLSITGPVDINTRAGAQLNLRVSGGSPANVYVHGKLDLTAHVLIGGNLHTSGGTIRFIGPNAFDVHSHAEFNSNLVGSATLSMSGGNAAGTSIEIDGAVGAGLTFDLTGGAPVLSLQLDQPHRFHGLIDIGNPFSLGYVAFMGLHATSADLRDDILQMFDHNRVVDTVRLSSGGTNLQLQQNSAGVILTGGFTSPGQPGGPGTPIPLNISEHASRHCEVLADFR